MQGKVPPGSVPESKGLTVTGQKTEDWAAEQPLLAQNTGQALWVDVDAMKSSALDGMRPLHLLKSFLLEAHLSLLVPF